MLAELKSKAQGLRQDHALRGLLGECRRLLSERGEANGPAIAQGIVERIDASINEHRVLIDAIEQRDAVRAERAMHDHLMAQLAALKALQHQESRKATRGAAGGRVRGASSAGGRRAG